MWGEPSAEEEPTKLEITSSATETPHPRTTADEGHPQAEIQQQKAHVHVRNPLYFVDNTINL